MPRKKMLFTETVNVWRERCLTVKNKQVILLLATFFNAPVYGNAEYDNLNIAYAVSYHGQCTMKHAIDQQVHSGTCNGMMTFVFKNRRVQYLFPHNENGHTKLVVFSGGVDRQPVLSHYELEIDTVILLEPESNKPTRKSAKGLCTMDGDPNAVATFRCTAVLSEQQAAQNFEFVFESEGVDMYSTSSTP